MRKGVQARGVVDKLYNRLLTELWQQWAPAWPVLIVEEAQDLAVCVIGFQVSLEPESKMAFCFS